MNLPVCNVLQNEKVMRIEITADLRPSGVIYLFYF